MLLLRPEVSHLHEVRGGIRTVFNILGPLTNPARPRRILLGVYDSSLAEPLAQVLMKLDEISLSAPTTVCQFGGGTYRTYEITPKQFGLARCQKANLTGSTPEENAAITRAILGGTERGHKRNVVLLNAGAALYTGRKAEDLAGGVQLAGELIDSGRALAALEAVKAASRKG